tara:strand:- start:351 stop:1214 length:864 start_codon:yes stop_codon:yes gene_type:complete
MNNIENKVTIFMVAYNSSYEIENIIKKINSNIKILIIENSNKIQTKNYFENKFKNVRVILCKKNHGNTRGFNIGLKNSKTPYSLYLDMDVDFEVSIIQEFINFAEKIKDFALLVPQHQKNNYPKSWEFKPLEEDMEKIRMNKIHGHFLLFNMEAVKKVGEFDEKIFFYYEETDYCERINKKNLKIYLLKNMKVKHIGGGSYDQKYHNHIQPLRHWHIMWGKFYFFKKHYGYLRAYIETLPDFFEASFKILIFTLLNDKNKLNIYKNRLSGLLNSIIGKSSWKRPDEL